MKNYKIIAFILFFCIALPLLLQSQITINLNWGFKDYLVYFGIVLLILFSIGLLVFGIAFFVVLVWFNNDLEDYNIQYPSNHF
jgi:hypothetical protein